MSEHVFNKWADNSWNTTQLVLNIMQRIARLTELDYLNRPRRYTLPGERIVPLLAIKF